MKTRFFLLAAAAIFAFSCTEELEPASRPQTGEQVTIRVSTADGMDGKVSMTESGDKSAMLLAWEEGDKLSINGNEFGVTNILSDHEAEFEGDAPAGSSFDIIYPGEYADAAAFAARSYAGQAQNGNSSTAHLEYNAMLSGVSDYREPKFDPAWAEDKEGILIQNGVIQLRLQLPAGVTTATSVILYASRPVFPTTNAGTDKVSEQTLSLSNVTLTNRVLEAYMMFSAAGVDFQADDKLTIAVNTPEGIFVRTLTMTAQTWKGGGQYTIQCKVSDDSFKINNADDLQYFRDGVNSGSLLWQTCHVSLKADIDCSDITSWTPIGNGTFTPTEGGSVSAEWTEPAFKGIFDGQGHAIKNLVMTASPQTYAPYGLFGILYGAEVKNLTLGAESGDTGALTVTPQGRMDAGAVAGVSFGATIRNVTNYYPMTIPDDNSSPNRVSLGMVGYLYGDADSGPSTLRGLNNYGKVTATQSSANDGNGATSVQVAGIAGFGNTGAGSVINQISGSTNYAEIDANTGRCAGVLGAANTRTALSECNNRGYVHNSFSSSRVGGLCVILGGNSSITDCHNYGNVQVSGGSGNVGGLVCLVNAATAGISGSSNEGVITGAAYTGGIVANLAAGTITQCVNLGKVTGTQYVGGIAGRQGNNDGWPYLNQCRSNATITATSDAASCAGGIVGLMQGGVLNTCFAKGAVVANGYDVGGIVGQMYCNNGTYGRQYVYDCLAAIDVSSSRASGSANVGGVAGRIVRKEDYTGQYMALENCIGLNQSITSARPYTGALVGNVDAKSTTNASRVRVSNCISLVDDSNYHAKTSAQNTGGFVGAYLGQLAHCYYLVADNNQTAVSGTPVASNLTQSNLATLTSAGFCTEHSERATDKYGLTVNGVAYRSTGWVIPEGCTYPVPKTLADLGEAYYK